MVFSDAGLNNLGKDFPILEEDVVDGALGCAHTVHEGLTEHPKNPHIRKFTVNTVEVCSLAKH